MTEAERIALISSGSLILGAIGNHFFKPLAGFCKSIVDRKSGNIAKMRHIIDEQEKEIQNLKNSLAALNLKLEILLPLLKHQLKDDPQAMRILANFNLEGNLTSSKT